jgi:anti-anti-sigma regulatory factor
MRWGRRAKVADRAPADRDPVVVTVTRPLSLDTAMELVAEVRRMPETSRIVIDVTGIPAFDSDGAVTLMALQESVDGERVTIVGFRQAAARLVGDPGAESAPPAVEHGWTLRRLQRLAVIALDESGSGSTDELEPVLAEALGEDVAIVVVDLRGVAELTAAGLQALTFASSDAAHGGQELLVVNAGAEAAERLRHSGLSATTYVAPQTLPDG